MHDEYTDDAILVKLAMYQRYYGRGMSHEELMNEDPFWVDFCVTLQGLLNKREQLEINKK